MPGPSSRTTIDIAVFVSDALIVMVPPVGLKSRALFIIFPIACSNNIFSAFMVDFLAISITTLIFLLAIALILIGAFKTSFTTETIFNFSF